MSAPEPIEIYATAEQVALEMRLTLSGVTGAVYYAFKKGLPYQKLLDAVQAQCGGTREDTITDVDHVLRMYKGLNLKDYTPPSLATQDAQSEQNEALLVPQRIPLVPENDMALYEIAFIDVLCSRMGDVVAKKTVLDNIQPQWKMAGGNTLTVRTIDRVFNVMQPRMRVFLPECAKRIAAVPGGFICAAPNAKPL